MLFNEPKLPKYATAPATGGTLQTVSVLFNEPKLPKLQTQRATHLMANVSVLFNEPKLPKSNVAVWRESGLVKFQCSSTSRNCRNSSGADFVTAAPKFQCSSTSRNCRNLKLPLTEVLLNNVSVLFNEPKLPKFLRICPDHVWR